MQVHQAWMDAISDNVANINTVRSDRQPRSRPGTCSPRPPRTAGRRRTAAACTVAGIALGSAQGRLVYSPDDPLADAKGYVRLPDIDLGEQMTDMIMAQRGYQANAANLDRIRASYQAALQMGRG